LKLRYLPTRFNGLWLRTPVESWTSLVRTYESYVAAVLRERLSRGGSLVDIGAHYGFWSLYGARLVGPSGKVIACDPSPAYSVLERAARSYPWITPLRIGLGAEESIASFHAHGTSSSGSFVRNVTDINLRFAPNVPVTEERVPIRTLDGLLAQTSCQPAVVKVDVEGFELNVLKGARDLLKSSVFWIIEVHPLQLQLSGGSERELEALLAENGFSTRTIDRNPNSLYTIVAEK
jgi:FkbM family methyltransferase